VAFQLEISMLTTLRARRAVARACLATMCALAIALPAIAQSATGSIEGTVVDPSAAVLPGVTVTVTERDTGAVRSVVTDDQGLFRAPVLPVGRYTVAAELSGFNRQEQQDVVVTIGQTVTLRIPMRLASVAESVTVSATVPVIETTRSQVSSTVGEISIDNLPVNGRNFIDFALLTPGVTRDVRSGDISFAGQRGTLNSLVVDGADNNNTFFGQTLGRTGTGRAPYQFSQDAVKEFQVNSNAYSAEFGRAGGAVINVVTKSGTNTYAGSIFEFYRDKALNANDAVNVLNNRPKSPYHYNQFGGSLGGPLRRDRAFFFVNYDGQRNTQPNDVIFSLPSGTPGDAATLAAIARLRPLAETWTRTQNQDVFLLKTDHQINAGGRLTVRYNHQNFTGDNFESGGPQIALEHTGASNVRTRTLNGSLTSVLGAALFNEVRGQWARDQEPGLANSANPEATIRQGGATVLTIGRNFFSPRETTIKRLQAADTVTWVRGPHKVKGGVDMQFDRILNFFPGNFSGSYLFNSLAAFASGRPNAEGERYVQAFAGAGTSGPTTEPNIDEYSFFVQDEWRATPALTLNAGVRYDLQKFAKPPVRNPDPQLARAGIDTSMLNTDTNNWGPRVGVAYSPDGKPYVVRGGYGVFYGRTPSIMVGTAHSNNGINVQTITFTGDLVPTYPATLATIPTGAALPKPTIFTFDADYQNARVQQASTGVDLQIARDTSLSFSYLFVKADDLPRSTDINIGAASPTTYTVTTTGQALPHYRFAAGPFTNFARVISFQSTAESTYNGVTVELNRRFAARLQGRVAYTLGKVEDTVPDATAVVPQGSDDAKFASNPADFEADRAPGNNDQRHRVVLSGTFMTDRFGRDGALGALLEDWTFAAILSAGSGQPYSAYVTADINADGNNRNDIAPGTARNEFRLPAQVTFDPRIARDIRLGARPRLQLIFEAFNLLNGDNFTVVRQNLYSSTGTTLTPVSNFGEFITSAGPRIIQLAVKLMF
jgi:outer membrane receptor protein involved in Fe transport